MFYHVVITALFMAGECCSVSTGVNFIQGPPDVYLNCIQIIEITFRSIIECALRASQMAHYENRFAFSNGKCHVCRADNENCAVSDDEYQLAGPHFVRGGSLVIMCQWLEYKNNVKDNNFVIITSFLYKLSDFMKGLPAPVLIGF